jgi:hypothetical protein
MIKFLAENWYIVGAVLSACIFIVIAIVSIKLEPYMSDDDQFGMVGMALLASCIWPITFTGLILYGIASLIAAMIKVGRK